MKQIQPHMPSKPSVFLWTVVFLLACGLSVLIPPMQSPDEHAHIARAYAISNGHFLLEPLPPSLDSWKQQYAAIPEIDKIVQRTLQNGKPAGAWVDAGLVAFLQAYENIGKHGGVLSETEANQVHALTWTSEQVYFPMPGTGYYLPLIYVPQALGLRIGQWLDLGIQNAYRLTRVLSLIISLALLASAFRWLRPSPIILGLLLLPMSLFQLLSPTLDGVTNSLAIFCLSLFLTAVHPDQRNPLRMATLLALSIVLLVTSRNQLAPMLLLPMFVAWRHKSARCLVIALCAITAALGWTFFAMLTTNDQRVLRHIATSTLLLHYLENPSEFFQIIFTTLGNSDLVSFYQQSFIGILGWLTTPLSTYWYPIIWIGLGLCGVTSFFSHDINIDYRCRLLLLITAIASVLLTFLALLASWTPYPTQIVNGIQGRYFMVPALIFGLAISGVYPTRFKYQNLMRIATIGLFACICIVALVAALLSRYHMT